MTADQRQKRLPSSMHTPPRIATSSLYGESGPFLEPLGERFRTVVHYKHARNRPKSHKHQDLVSRNTSSLGKSKRSTCHCSA